MKFLSLIKSILILILTGSLLLAQDQVYTLNSLAETVSYWDGAVNTNNVITLGLYPNDLAIRGDTLFALNSGSHSLQLFNRSSFAALGTIQLPENSNPYEMIFEESGRAIISCFQNNQIARVNLDGSGIDTATTGDSPEGLCISGNQLFVTSSNFNDQNWTYGPGSVTVHALSDLAVIREIPVPTNPQKIILAGNGLLHVLCTGDYFSEFGTVVRIDPQTLIVLDTLTIGGSPGTFAEDVDGIVYLAAGGWGSDPAGLVYTYDSDSFTLIHGPDNPLEVGHGIISVTTDPGRAGVWVASFDTDEIYQIEADGDVQQQISVGDGPSKIALFSVPGTGVEAENPPLDFRIGAAFPNPFNPSTEITFGLPKEGYVTVSIYNVLGVKVRTLAKGNFSAGYHRFVWDAKNEFGNEVAPGMYIYRLESSSQTLTQKMILLK